MAKIIRIMVVRCTGRLFVLWHRRMITSILLLALFCGTPWNTHCVASFSMNQQHQYQHRHSNQHVRIRARGGGLRKDIALSLLADTATTATSMITDMVSSSSMDTNIITVPSIGVPSIAAAHSWIASSTAVVVATIGGEGSRDRDVVLQSVARGLGYLVGTGSVLLYTPIAVRIVRQQRAEGLTVSTWWCKLLSYTCTIFYSYDKGFPLSTYAETIIIALEALTILLLVTYFQQQPQPPQKTERTTSSTGTPATVTNNEQEETTTLFLGTLGVFLTVVLVVLTGTVTVPSEVLAVGQGGSTLLNVGALVPQFKWNATTQTSGDYSPITALLASVGCTIRVFTTYQLTEADPILLFSYGTAFLLNTALFVQILYYGVRFEQNSIRTVLTADYNTNTNTNTNTNASDKNEE